MTTINGLEDDDAALVEALLDQLARKAIRNQLRSLYYDAKVTPRQLGITMPPQLANRMSAVLNWPAKAVDALAERIAWQGVSIDDVDLQAAAEDLIDANRLITDMPQVITSALEHSVSFLIATSGLDGEPEAVITAKDALNGTGLWDPRRRELASFLSVTARDDEGQPSAVSLLLPGRTVNLVRTNNVWGVEGDWVEHDVDGVPVEMLAYNRRLDRPFGTSRISRPVMSITDMAVRTVIRSEVGAEFYATPQRWLMGASSEDFENGDEWKALVARIFALDDKVENDTPSGAQQLARAEVGQFPQMTQQPHMDQLRALAQLYAGTTGIPVGSLGISADSNPTSAEAYAASREDIIADAEAQIRDWRGATSRIVGKALTLAGQDVAGTKILSKFRDPRYTSQAAAADAMTKMMAVMPWLADSDTAIELLGFDEVTTQRLLADKRRAQGRATLSTLVGKQAGE